MRNNNDESLFAWKDDSISKSGLLAASPAAFKDSGAIKSLNPQWLYRPPYSMTNKGLQIEFNFAELRLNVAELRPKVIAPLNCAREGDQTQVVALLLANDGLSEVGFIRAECGTLRSYDKDNTRDLQPRAALYIREPQIASGTSSRCYFRINTQQLRSSRVDVKELHLANSDLGHWSKGSETGYTLRICNTNALMLFEKGDDRFILRISSEEGASCLHLLVRQSDNPITVTEILHLRKEPPVIPHWSHLSGLKSYIAVHPDQVRKALPSGKGVQISFHKTENRPRFEIEVSLIPSYVPITSRVFPLPMNKLKPVEVDAQVTEAEILLQESEIHTRAKKAYLSPPQPAAPRAISPARPISPSPAQPRPRKRSPPTRPWATSMPDSVGWRYGPPSGSAPSSFIPATLISNDLASEQYRERDRDREPDRDRERDRYREREYYPRDTRDRKDAEDRIIVRAQEALRAARAHVQKEKEKREMDREMPPPPKPEIHESTF
jgi:hypothetical protein